MINIILLFLSPIMAFFINPVASSRNELYDTQRQDDMARIIATVNMYQTNNSGKTPWDTDIINPNYVRRYIDTECTSTGDKADESCGYNFRDPDGEPYYFIYGGQLSSDKVVKVEKNHGIYVYAKAHCGDGKGALKLSSSKRDIAMLYRLSNGIACVDNY